MSKFFLKLHDYFGDHKAIDLYLVYITNLERSSFYLDNAVSF